MKITLLGGTGSIGRVFLEEAIAAGHELRIYGRTSPNANGADFIRGELSDKVAMTAAVRGSDAVVNTVGVRSKDDIPVITVAVSNIITVMENADVRRLVVSPAQA
ncbi:NAD(P)H-binding protein [Bradyrhizobium tunisiense]|uniref:NAD(P)H-binding protein n=1 Tax=Bradyrhizobium tunisiense TaxID=3278709 RepID=UPI0035D8960D